MVCALFCSLILVVVRCTEQPATLTEAAFLDTGLSRAEYVRWTPAVTVVLLTATSLMR